MAEPGTNIQFQGTTPIDRIDQLGATVLRTVLTRQYSLLEYFRTLRGMGFRIAGAITGESVGTFRSRPEAFRWYARWYTGVVDSWIILNEPDIVSPASMGILSPAVQSRWYKQARKALGDGAYLVGGGYAGGNPALLNGVDFGSLDAISVHTYGRWGSGADRDPSWYFGYGLDLLYEYRTWLDSHGWGHIGLHNLEWGFPAFDFESPAKGIADWRGMPAPITSFTDVAQYLRYARRRAQLERTLAPPHVARRGQALERQAAAVQQMALTLRGTDVIGDHAQFCLGADMVPPYALEGTPSFAAYQAVNHGFV